MAEKSWAPDRSKLYHYKLDQILGEGGTGRVYRALDTQQGQVVAIKLFHENFFRHKLHLRDVVKSVKRFKKLDHPNLVKILDFIDGDEGRCIIMEYIDGPNLRWYIVNRPWNLAERLTIVAQICNGLQYLHDNNNVHHDFKPANVLFTRRGQVKIVDFSLYGSSFLLEMFDTGAGEQVTPMFVPPEFLRKDRITARSDQYSLGVTMYAMFADRLPFMVDSLERLKYCHLRVTPDHPTDVNEKCPRELGDIIMQMLAKQPKDRFGDMDEIRIAISTIGKRRI